MLPTFSMSPGAPASSLHLPRASPWRRAVEAYGEPSGGREREPLGPVRPRRHRATAPGGSVQRPTGGAVPGPTPAGGARRPPARRGGAGSGGEGRGSKERGGKRLGGKEADSARRRGARARAQGREPEPSPGRGGAGLAAGGELRGSAPGERGGRSEGSAGRRPRSAPPARNSSPKVAARQTGCRPRTQHRGGMGTRQTKGSLAERASPGAAPGPRRERPDFWASLLLRAGDKAGRAGAGAGLPPYHRRVGMVQELLRMVRQGRREEAGTLLQHLRQVSAGSGRGGRAGPGSAPPLPEKARERRGAPPRAPSRGDGARSGSRCLGAPTESEASGQGGGRMVG